MVSIIEEFHCSNVLINVFISIVLYNYVLLLLLLLSLLLLLLLGLLELVDGILQSLDVARQLIEATDMSDPPKTLYAIKQLAREAAIGTLL